MTFTEIGKKAKAASLEYADLSDYDAGIAYASKHLKKDFPLIEDDQAVPPVDTSHKVPRLIEKAPDPGFFFPARQAAYHQNQVADFTAKVDLEIAQENYAARMEINARTNDEQVANLPKRLAEAELQVEATHDQIMDVHETAHIVEQGTRHLIKQGVKRDVDVATLNLIRLDEERADVEIKKNYKLAAIEVSKSRHLERNRLEAYKREVQIDLNSALCMHMMDVEKIDYISRKLADLRKQGADPQRIAFLEKLRVQMEGRLLEADDEEDLAGIDPPAES